jgi:predicted Fe-Mo cluster-binding NifX family protein
MDLMIAIPSNDGINVEEHFGHCREFLLIGVQDDREISRETLTPPEHAPGVFPAFLAEKGTDVIITGGMGGRAVELFKTNDIDVILGARGSINDNLRVFLGGELTSSGSICSSHERGCHS